MDSHAALQHVIVIFALTVAINIPFGYLRTRTRRFSLWWFLCIHAPIPLIFLARTLSHLDFRFIPVFIVAAVLGQVVGGKVDLPVKGG
jgi:hypothetical protein